MYRSYTEIQNPFVCMLDDENELIIRDSQIYIFIDLSFVYYITVDYIKMQNKTHYNK